MRIRKANVDDVKAIKEIIDPYAKKEIMLPRPLSELFESVRNFYICEEDGEIIGCCALQVSWQDMAEVLSLAVKPEYTKKGIGSILLDACLNDARELKVSTVFTLTYAVPFFEKKGFNVVDKHTLPHKIWSGCIKCPKFPNCDEVAMIRKL
ncbi:MAG: N-acetyltransferase [Methanolobus sp.]|uniref:N-acetyltransferase n=1 Tax=Methanolobus sp. TaxID=1874737 RepID=UPI00272F149B|nr:N-acetyltransferase [Methanolobus sp.]MDP2215953.1 N-acetyltransferase [Methanolobus sp.]